MIWLTVRQQRVALLVSVAVFVALVGYIVWIGIALHDIYDRSGLADCAAPVALSCPGEVTRIRDVSGPVPMQLSIAAFLMPALLAAFVGAPLVAREVEHGTHRLAWMQSVSRTRWLAMKTAVLGALLGAGLLVLGFLIRWAIAPMLAVGSSEMDPMAYNVTGLVPMGYGLLALAGGIATGAALGRMLTAIATSLVLFTGLWFGVGALREHFAAPERATIDVTTMSGAMTLPLRHRGWVLSNVMTSADGQVMSSGDNVDWVALSNRCIEAGFDVNIIEGIGVVDVPPACIDMLGLTRAVTYQPSDRFWRFQLTETALLLALAVGLFAVARHRVARRIA